MFMECGKIMRIDFLLFIIIEMDVSKFNKSVCFFVPLFPVYRLLSYQSTPSIGFFDVHTSCEMYKYISDDKAIATERAFRSVYTKVIFCYYGFVLVIVLLLLLSSFEVNTMDEMSFGWIFANSLTLSAPLFLLFLSFSPSLFRAAPAKQVKSRFTAR